MEQVLVRGLRPGTKAALRALAFGNGRSVEAEARAILDAATRERRPSLADMLDAPETYHIDFEPPARESIGRLAPL